MLLLFHKGHIFLQYDVALQNSSIMQYSLWNYFLVYQPLIYFFSGDISGSGRSTPDSSHNNSPEMKRKILDLHTLSTDPRPTALSQDKSPLTFTACKTSPRSVSSLNQDKSPAYTSPQTFPGPQSTERPPSTQSSKAGTPTSSDILMNIINSEKRGCKKYGGKSKGQMKLLQTPFIDGSIVSMKCIWLYSLRSKRKCTHKHKHFHYPVWKFFWNLSFNISACSLASS